MEFNALYYYKIESNDDLTRKGDIKMLNCVEIVEKAVKESSKEKGFSFKINMGDRLFHFMTYNEEERKELLLFFKLNHLLDEWEN